MSLILTLKMGLWIAWEERISEHFFELAWSWATIALADP
jgi:hypothetical protein